MLGNILAVGLMSMGMGLSGIKDEPQMYAENESTYTITYNAEDWQEKAQDVANWLQEKGYNQENTLAVTGTLKASSNYSFTTICYNTISHGIAVTYAQGNLTYSMSNEVWTLNGSTLAMTELSITSQTYYEGNKYVPPSMGETIIGSIASGLGIIGALATTFLTGFGNLFYAEGALTPFAIFALVMLGIAVSFAVVKLVLNLIRSNTGA